jgi:hypothetical protein
MEQQQLFSQSTAAAQPANNRIDNGNNNNNSLLISSLKDLDMELNQRNAAALQELNKEIDELSEIPLDSSQLPRFKDGIEFTSSSNQATPTSTLDQQRASSARRANDVKLIDKELANGFGSLQEKLHDMDSNLAADKTKEELDRKLKNILDMSKPYQAENYSEVKGNRLGIALFYTLFSLYRIPFHPPLLTSLLPLLYRSKNTNDPI